MRHRKKGRKLNRTWEHRKAMFKNMAQSLVVHGRIKTTLPKAKELRRVADKLITLALRNDLPARRQAFKILENHGLVKKLFDEIGPRFKDVPGGYTRVVKLALPRRGDCAKMAIVEFSVSGEKKEENLEKAEETAAKENTESAE
ncbi:MAG: large subunit ribosomal protein [Desulfonauticus sp.]|jgi:large subunit ribosomal protein L17|nr:large subunit ribosomal protein [Desulfonauticus sp.]